MTNLRKDRHGQDLMAPAKLERLAQSFLDLACVMERLRSECPWDRKQTPQSLRRYILEEAYEVLEAIDGEDWDALCDELGDFTLQVVFQAKIQAEQDRFNLEDVMTGIVDKMVRRHPHVFGDREVADAEEVATNWEAIKAKEKGLQGPRSALDGMTKGLPALLESFKLTKKAAKVGFDWDRPEDVFGKIEEELAEVRQAAMHPHREGLGEELGDLLFAVANLSRHYGFEPEETLRLGNQKFDRRFRMMEKLAADQGQQFSSLSLVDQEKLWHLAKKVERG